MGRKTLRDGGAAEGRIAALIAQTEDALQQGSPTAQNIAARLGSARQDFQVVIAHLLTSAPNEAYAGAVPYLMLAGNLVAGWQMARAVLVAEAAQARHEDRDFMSAKIATARFYAHHILTKTGLQRLRVMDGAASLLDAVF